MTTDLGIDIGGTKILLVAQNANRDLVAETRAPTGPGTTPQHLEALIRSFAADLGDPIGTVAVAVPGLVGPDGAVVDSDVLPGLRGWRPRLPGTSSFVVNDVRASLAYAANTAATTDVLCVVAGTAIAAAFTNSATTTPFHGADGWAGELGYLPTPRPDGSWTTLDELAGGAALLRALDLTAAEVRQRIDAGDPRVRAAVHAAGTALGRAIAGCVNLLNPRTLFVGGGTCRYPGYLDAALDAARASGLAQSWAALTVRAFPDPDRFVALGALVAATHRE